MNEVDALLGKHKRTVDKRLQDLQQLLRAFQTELVAGPTRQDEPPIRPVMIYHAHEVAYHSEAGNMLHRLEKLGDPYSPEQGRRLAADAISNLDYTHVNGDGRRRCYGSPRCYGAIGVPTRMVRAAEEINRAKKAFRDALAPLVGKQKFVAVDSGGGRQKIVKMSLSNALMAELGEPHFNVRAAYRRIPVFQNQAARIAFRIFRSHTVTSRTAAELIATIAGESSSQAENTIDKLRSIPADEKLRFRSRVYPCLIMRVTASRSAVNYDTKRYRTPIEIKPAELPLIFANNPNWPDPVIDRSIHGTADGAGRPRTLEEEPFVTINSANYYRLAEPYLSAEYEKREERKRQSLRASHAEKPFGNSDY